MDLRASLKKVKSGVFTFEETEGEEPTVKDESEQWNDNNMSQDKNYPPPHKWCTLYQMLICPKPKSAIIIKSYVRNLVWVKSEFVVKRVVSRGGKAFSDALFC